MRHQDLTFSTMAAVRLPEARSGRELAPFTHAVSALVAPATRRVQIVLCLGAFLAALNFYAPTPFYPEIAHDLHTTVPLLGKS